MAYRSTTIYSGMLQYASVANSLSLYGAILLGTAIALRPSGHETPMKHRIRLRICARKSI